MLDIFAGIGWILAVIVLRQVLMKNGWLLLFVAAICAIVYVVVLAH